MRKKKTENPKREKNYKLNKFNKTRKNNYKIMA